MRKTPISRRSLLKATALAGAASALGIAGCNKVEPVSEPTTSQAQESNPQPEDTSGRHSNDGIPPEQYEKIKTTCHGCITNCTCEAWLLNGRLAKIVGVPGCRRNDGRICLKGMSQVQAVYHPNHLKYPIKRVGERGENKWERISWNDALSLAAEKIIEVRSKYGGGGLLASGGGGGSVTMFHLRKTIWEMGFWNLFEPGASQCLAPRTAATTMVFGLRTYLSMADGQGEDLFWPEDENCKCLVVWGTNPASHQTAGSGRLMRDLRAHGVKTVVVDPRFTPDAARADVWLPIRPGTDVALMLAWVRYIIEHEAFDSDFCMRWTNLPYLIDPETEYCLTADKVFEDGNPEDYVVWDTLTNSPKSLPYYPFPEDIKPAFFGEYEFAGVGGKQYKTKTGFEALKQAADEWTIAKAAETCWLREESIEQALKLFIEEQVSGIVHGVATDQHPQAEKAAQCACIIEGMMGHVEIPGSVLQQFGKKGVNQGGRPGCGEMTEEACVNTLGTAKKYRALFAPSCNSHIPSVLDAITSGEPYRPVLWYDGSLNKLSALAEPEKWLEASKNMEFIFGIAPYMTSFHYELCDLVLPSQEWSEMNDTVEHAFNQHISHRAVVHIGETVHPAVIASKVVEACKKLDDSISVEKVPGLTDEAYANSCAPKDMTWKDFCELEDKEGYYEKCSEEDYRTYRNYERFIDDATEPQGFPTPTRKAELYGTGFLRCRDTGLPFAKVDLGSILGPAEGDWRPLPYYKEPEESPLTDKEYPLVMTCGRVPYFHHGTLRNNAYLRELYPAPELWVNPETAKTYGIADKDWVKVSSRRGTVTMRAWVTEGIAPGVVASERFWNPEKMEDPKNPTGGWREMNYNVLSKESGDYCPEVGSYTLRGYQVKIERTDSAPDGCWVEPKEFTPWLPEYSESTEVVF